MWTDRTAAGTAQTRFDSHEQVDRLRVRALYLKVSIVAGMIAALVLSSRLWLSSRSYPLTPIWNGLPSVTYPWDGFLFSALLAALAVVGLRSRPVAPIAVALVLGLGLAMLDQSRWQPWFYQYLFMLGAMGVYHRAGAGTEQRRASWNTCRLVVVSVYFWSGIQKLNSGFVDDIFPWLVEPLTRFLPAALQIRVSQLGWMVPAVEIGIAVGLLNSKVRSAAVASAISMHMFLLVAIGPFVRSTNTVIWSWNLVMAGFVIVLFWRATDFSIGDILLPQNVGVQWVALVFVTLAPALSLFNRWDNYLSWALYSGNKNEAHLFLNDSAVGRLPATIQQYAFAAGANTNELNIARWSALELNVPPYPEVRVYKSLARTVCAYSHNPTDVLLVVKRKSGIVDGHVELRFDCSAFRGF